MAPTAAGLSLHCARSEISPLRPRYARSPPLREGLSKELRLHCRIAARSLQREPYSAGLAVSSMSAPSLTTASRMREDAASRSV